MVRASGALLAMDRRRHCGRSGTSRRPGPARPCPAAPRRSPAARRASPVTTSTPSFSNIEPLGQASRDTIRARCPASTSARTVARPTNPAPPVTRTFIADSLSSCRGYRPAASGEVSRRRPGGPERAHSNVRKREPHGPTPPGAASGGGTAVANRCRAVPRSASPGPAAGGVEAREVEVLLELEVDVVARRCGSSRRYDRSSRGSAAPGTG